jgi:hypothetical protein
LAADSMGFDALAELASAPKRSRCRQFAHDSPGTDTPIPQRNDSILHVVPGGPNCHSPGEIAGRGVLAHACRALKFFFDLVPEGS